MLSTVISRLRGQSRSGAVPLVPAYDSQERTWLPPAPVLFRRRFGSEHRRISAGAVREMLDARPPPSCSSGAEPGWQGRLHRAVHPRRHRHGQRYCSGGQLGKAITALHAGDLPCSSSEAATLGLAASLVTASPVVLRHAITGLDRANLHLIIDAIRNAGGQK